MPTPKSYEEMARGRMPRWLQGTWADRLSAILFGTLDVINEGAKQAAKAGLIDECPDDAVPAHGRARALESLASEAAAAFRLRIAEAWTTWAESGTKAGLEALLRLYSGASSLRVYDIANDNWPTGFVGDGFDDINDDLWSRVTVVVPRPHPWTQPTVGPGLVVGPELIVGITMTGTELSRIRRIFRQFKPAHIVGIDIDVLLDSTTADDWKGDHAATVDVVRIPLHAPMVGYLQHGMTVGPHLIVGQAFV